MGNTTRSGLKTHDSTPAAYGALGRRGDHTAMQKARRMMHAGPEPDNKPFGSFVKGPTGVELRPIPGFIGYAAGSDGHVYSFRRSTGSRYKFSLTPRRMKERQHSNGYMRVSALRHMKKRHHIPVAALVCSAFHGRRPKGMTCSHLNGDRTDNRPENLCWECHRDNDARKDEHGTRLIGERANRARLTAPEVIEIRERAANGETRESLAREFGMSKNAVGCIIRRDSWRHI